MNNKVLISNNASNVLECIKTNSLEIERLCNALNSIYSLSLNILTNEEQKYFLESIKFELPNICEKLKEATSFIDKLQNI